MSLASNSKLEELIRLLDRAVCAQETKQCCYSVKDALEEIVRSGEEFVDARFMVPCVDRYARRLVHKDPGGAYTLLAMVWGPGQGTKVHDHAHSWCVECVYRGRIRVVPYDLLSPEDADVLKFQPQPEIFAGVGEAGALIPPYEYHTIENLEATPAVTLHVYGGELTWCNVFNEVEGGFTRELKQLCYTD